MEKVMKTTFGFGAVVLLLLSFGYGTEQKSSREEAQFTIFVAGKEIGQEKYSIQNSGDSVTSKSTTSFRDPGNSRQSVKMETSLTMDARFLPRSYELLTDVGGQKGMMKGTFSQGQADFEYLANGAARKIGLLVGDSYLMLDTNVFHHFVFIARRFDMGSQEKSQSIEVLIPQEFENGVLKISNVGLEKLSIRGKDRQVHHLKADSGLVQIDLWVDTQRILHKIALPAKKIEVIRG